MAINRVVIDGIVVEDSQLCHLTEDNKIFLKFKILHTHKAFDELENAYFNCVMFGQRAFTFVEHIVKGTFVTLDGVLKEDSGQLYLQIIKLSGL